MDLEILKIDFYNFDSSILCETKIKMRNKKMAQKYLIYLENYVKNKQPTLYFSDIFNNFVINLSRSVMKNIQHDLFKYLEQINLKNKQNLYYILAEYNNFGIRNVVLQNNNLVFDLQFELYCYLKDFTNISRALSHSNHQIYTHCLSNDASVNIHSASFKE